MEYVSVAKMAEKWGLSERSVRNYCANGRIADAKLIGKVYSGGCTEAGSCQQKERYSLLAADPAGAEGSKDDRRYLS